MLSSFFLRWSLRVCKWPDCVSGGAQFGYDLVLGFSGSVRGHKNSGLLYSLLIAALLTINGIAGEMGMLRQECLLAARWINGTIGLRPWVSEGGKG